MVRIACDRDLNIIIMDTVKSETCLIRHALEKIFCVEIDRVSDYSVKHIKYCQKGMIFCLFEVYPPTQEFFTHMKMSPLPAKGCKF